mmetsp:Transcript_16660/g.37334  ORF Transcript_16660/g.37334 Transcript_16660/m.37334 type:complete len:102 (-) Transcript_16660:3088-3393(-)
MPMPHHLEEITECEDEEETEKRRFKLDFGVLLTRHIMSTINRSSRCQCKLCDRFGLCAAPIPIATSKILWAAPTILRPSSSEEVKQAEDKITATTRVVLCN